VRKEVRGYRKQLRKARFQQKVLPEIVMILKPSLLSAMSQMDMGDGAEGAFRACKADGEKDCVPVDKINIVSLLLNFAEVNLQATLWPHLYELFKKIEEKIWDVVDPIQESTKASLIASVGSIPIVGGALASVVSAVCTVIYKIVKIGVGVALGMVRKALQNLIVKGVMVALTPVITEMFKPGAQRDAKLLENVADQAAKKESNNEAREVRNVANAGKKKALREKRKAEKAVMADGEQVEKQEERSDAKDKAEDESDEAKDNDDEE